MKKKYLILLLFPVVCSAQKFDKKKPLTTALDSVVYHFTSETIGPSQLKLPFKKIKIIDARYDTSKLGFEVHKEYDFLRMSDFKRIKLIGGVALGIENFYNDYYKLCFQDTGSELIIVLKTLWIDNFPSKEITDVPRRDMVKESYQNIHTKFEYYLAKGNFFYPIKRTDTVYQLTESIINSPGFKFKKNDLSFFTYAIKSLIEKYEFEELVKNSDSKRKLYFTTIDSFNQKRFLLPALNAQKLNEGIFISFKDFVNNTPTINKYESNETRKEFYYINKNSGERVNKFFAVSDSIGIHTGNKIRLEIVRVGNTFESFKFDDIYSAKTLTGNLLNINSQNGPSNGAKREYVNVPRQINMETGEIY